MSDADQQPDDFGRRPTIGYDAARGADQSANPAQSTEQLADRYQLQERLGGGGMGEVWRAIDSRLKRLVAIKRIRRDLVRHPEAIQRFLTEAQAVARLNHVNIVQIYDYGDDPGGPYLVMELVQGQSLASLVKETGPMDPAAAIRITRQVCDALSLAHQNGIVHRDVKPANILLSADGTSKLGDFGVARLEESDHAQTRVGAVLGTLDFMAPEQLHDARQADARSDIWALGATLYQLITGQSPRVIHSDNIPGPLKGPLLKALSVSPDERYQTAREFSRALAELESSPAIDAAPPILAQVVSETDTVGQSETHPSIQQPATTAGHADSRKPTGRSSIWPRIALGLAAGALFITAIAVAVVLFFASTRERGAVQEQNDWNILPADEEVTEWIDEPREFGDVEQDQWDEGLFGTGKEEWDGVDGGKSEFSPSQSAPDYYDDVKGNPKLEYKDPKLEYEQFEKK